MFVQIDFFVVIELLLWDLEPGACVFGDIMSLLPSETKSLVLEPMEEKASHVCIHSVVCLIALHFQHKISLKCIKS